MRELKGRVRKQPRGLPVGTGAGHLCSPSPLHRRWHLQAKINAILWSISNTTARKALLWLPGTRTDAFLPALLRWPLLVAEERAASRLRSPLLSSLSTRLGARGLNCNLSCWPHRSCCPEPRQRVAQGRTRGNGGAGGDGRVGGMSLTGAAPGSGCACLLQASLCLSCSCSL